MPEIGASLREARMRQRIDISEVELETKIRAKYLRALENEEWDLLPGPTYVKSFLRTYAESLGLDGRLLVEEYKLRHERLSDVELQPIAPRSESARAGRGRRRRPSGGVPRWAVVLAVVAALLVALYFLGDDTGDQQPPSAVEPTTPSKTKTARPQHEGTSSSKSSESSSGASTRPRRSRIVRLQIVPTGDVFVCLTAVGQGTLVNGVILRPGDPVRTYRSRRFRLTLGNNRVQLRVNGRVRPVPGVTNGIGYEITRAGRTTLPAGKRPNCE
jgi:cytoskeleton protein RodZ